MKILLIVGMPGAGKEEFLSVAHSIGVPFIRMGDIVREFYNMSNAQGTGMTIGQFADRERETYGKTIWAIRTMQRMSGRLFLVDGCRSMSEVCYYKKFCNEVYITSIHAPRMIRYQRLVKRNRDDAPQNITEFNERDEREMRWGLSDVIALSDIMIVNSKDIKKFRLDVKETLEAIV